MHTSLCHGQANFMLTLPLLSRASLYSLVRWEKLTNLSLLDILSLGLKDVGRIVNSTSCTFFFNFVEKNQIKTPNFVSKNSRFSAFVEHANYKKKLQS